MGELQSIFGTKTGKGEHDLQERKSFVSIDNTNREEQFQLTPALIKARAIELKQLPLKELADIFRIQEGDPETLSQTTRINNKE